MNRFGLLGKDISYSLSPKIQKAIAKVNGYEIEYELFDIDKDELSLYINKLKKGHFQGLNVTKPYKTDVMPYLDGLTDVAKRIGAVNTIYMKDHKLIGDNTDYFGFKKSLELYNIDVSNQNVCIMGTGGAALACYQALHDLNAHIFVASRRPQDITNFPHVIGFDQIATINPKILINTTYVGVDIFKDYNIKPNPKSIVYDINYKPSITAVMSYVETSYNGLSMLIIQAIESQSIWFSKSFNTDMKTITQVKEDVFNE